MKLSTQTIASASARHPWRTIGVWIATFVLAMAAIGVLLGDSLTTEGAPTNNPESERAIDVIARAFPPTPETFTTDVVIVRSEQYRLDDPAFEAFVRNLLESSETSALAEARSYLTEPEAPISADGHATLIPIAILDDDDTPAVIEELEAANEDAAFEVAIAGERALDHDFNLLSQEDLEKGELQFGLPAALIILLLVFGAVVAGLIPLLMAIVSIVVALGLVAILAQQFELSIFVVNMLTGMGLALGIDYALFVISRYREERAKGLAKYDAIGWSGRTASRAVVFSGTAFVVAMFGMLLVPNSIMRSLAVGAIVVGIVSVAAATTLLPALLGLLGDRVNALRIPFFGRRALDVENPEGRFWGAIISRVLRRPGLSFAVSTAFLLLLAAPVLGMKVGTSGVSTPPRPLHLEAGLRRARERVPGHDHRSRRDRDLRGRVEPALGRGARRAPVDAGVGSTLRRGNRASIGRRRDSGVVDFGRGRPGLRRHRRRRSRPP